MIEQHQNPRTALGGIKHDADKNPLHLIPPEAVFALGEVLKYGANKYGDRNWERGMAWSRPYAALLRHLFAWWGGQHRDQESGLPHLWHALACLVFLVTYEAKGGGADDRPV
jgi:hypothetical protein